MNMIEYLVYSALLWCIFKNETYHYTLVKKNCEK